MQVTDYATGDTVLRKASRVSVCAVRSRSLKIVTLMLLENLAIRDKQQSAVHSQTLVSENNRLR